jgi:hypothetical protein
MPVLREITFELTPDEAAEIIGRGRSIPALKSEIGWAIETLSEVWQPAAVVEILPVLAVNGEEVRVKSPKTGAEVGLRLGPKADLMAPARLVQVSASTLGPALDKRVKELNQMGEPMKSFVLDSVGVLGLWQVGQAVRRLAEKTAADRGWGVGRGLSPGSLIGWSLQDQPRLCNLLPLEEIGVQVLESCVLVPLKSASLAIGLGPDYQAQKVGSVCRWCHNRETCWRARDDED